MIKIIAILKKIFTMKIIWDIFMVQAVILNLHLIIFDLTYLSMRPFYLKNLPAVASFYDPFLGIEPHRTTEKYLELSVEYYKTLNTPNSPERVIKLEEISKSLVDISIQMVEENSFEKSGLTGNLQQIKQIVKRDYRIANNIPEDKDVSSKDAFRWFWNNDPNSAMSHYYIFRDEIKPYMEPNYYRSFGLNGKYVDEFYKLDLPFFILFLLEFLIQWWLSLKRKEYVAWFLYPMYHWYDVLGLSPFAQFRFFRLFRLVSMYLHLRRTVFSRMGDDVVTRTIVYYSNIIKEELSDLVTIRILSEMQEEVRSGASRALFTSAIESRRNDIKRLMIINIRKGLTNAKANATMRKLLGEALVRSMGNANSLMMVPAILKENITKDIGLAIFDAMNEVVAAKLLGDEGEGNINMLVDGMIDDLILGSQDSEMNKLNEDMSIEIIENMKKAVSVKKWVKASV